MKGKVFALLASATVAACAWYLWPSPSVAPKITASAQSQGELAKLGGSVDVLASSTAEKPGHSDQVAQALALPFGISRKQAIERAGYDLTLASAEEAFAQLSKITDAADRAAMLRGLFSAAAQMDVHDAFSLLKRLYEPPGVDFWLGEYNLAMQTLAENWRRGESYEPPGVTTFPDEPFQLNAELARWLSKKRPDIAEVWAKELVTDSKTRAAVLAYVFLSRDFGTPQYSAKLRTMTEQMSAEEREVFTDRVAGNIAVSPFRARDLVGQLPPGELRTDVLVRLCRTFGKAPDNFAKEMYDRVPLGEGRSEGVAALAESWWVRDQRSASAWAASLSSDDRASAAAGFQKAEAGRK